jgi:hypothetical protein
MKANLANFPKVGPNGYDEAEVNQWKKDFESEAREILGNLQKEVKRSREEQKLEKERCHAASVQAYEEYITHDLGRIFSLKQVLGELPVPAKGAVSVSQEYG